MTNGFAWFKAIGISLLILVLAGSYARAAGKVDVVLQDQTGGTAADHMAIISTPDKVAAGRVSFVIRNNSKSLVHEMLLLRTSTSGDLPYDTTAQRIIERKTVKLVDTDDIPPGKSVTKTVRLRAGVYKMVCNEPGHYKSGMATTFTVTP